MYTSAFLTALLGVASAVGVQNPHDRAPPRPVRIAPSTQRAPSPLKHNNTKTAKFAVDGTKIPRVNFDVGESYAGTLSIDDDDSNESRLWFWFFPSDNPDAGDEITIWLNGGPGCSSLDGLFQENGPFLWQSGTFEPIANPYSWTNLTNMVWIDQPIGTGYSPAAPGAAQKIVNEQIVSEQFLGFWKNFMQTFDLVGRKVYLTGESYAGQYIPYIAMNMLEKDNKNFYNVKGMQINDPSIGDGTVLTDAPAYQHMADFAMLFNLNQSTFVEVQSNAEKCGYIDYMEKVLTYPPPKVMPAVPDARKPGCDVWDQIVAAAVYINPCFNIYHLSDYCPYLWDQLGFPSLGWGPNDYFNRTDVQQVVHAPPTDFTICGNPHLGLRTKGDGSPPSSHFAIPAVIEKTNNVIIGSGRLDFLLLMNGTLATIQNMTWNGKQGFQSDPMVDLLFVPYHTGLLQDLDEIFFQPDPSVPVMNAAGAGYLGTTHTERGLTFTTVDLAGHEIPQYVASASYRHLEFLLGRIKSLTQTGDFTTQTGNFTG